MNELATAPPRDIQLFEPPFDAVYSIEATAQIVDLPPRAVVCYYKHGLVFPVADPARGYYFNRDGIRRLRRIEGLRPLCRDTFASIKIILELMDEVERLRVGNLSREQSANGKSQSESSNKKEKT
jgi:DNA-binding transcriptional MerR regulator